MFSFIYSQEGENWRTDSDGKAILFIWGYTLHLTITINPFTREKEDEKIKD